MTSTKGRIAVSHLTVAYDRHAALRDVDGAFEPGSLTAVVGPNGAGKSTLVKAVVGLLRPAAGRVLRPDLTAHDVAYLPQAAEIDRSFPISVADTVLMGAWGRTGAFGRADATIRAAAEAALDAVGLARLGTRPVSALSVGQFQRVLFARLLLQDAPVMVLDEPFAAVDTRTVAMLLEIVRGWHRQGRTVIAVLHDLDLVRAHFPRSLLVAGQQIGWGTTATVLTIENLTRARALTAESGDARGGVPDRERDVAA